MNSKKKRIFFRVDGDHGKSHGLGHINRTLNLYEGLKKNYNLLFNFFFITKKNTLGHTVIQSRTKEKIFSKKIIYKKKFFKKNDIIIIDTLGAEKSFLSNLKASGVIKVISFEELNPNFFKKGLIINGIYFTNKTLKSNTNVKIYQNIKYIFLDPKFKTKKKLKSNNTVLITSGGTDIKNYLYKVSKIILDYFGINYKLYIILGRGVKKKNKIFNLKNHKNIKLIKNTNNLKKYIDRSTFCITSGGNVMFESISSGRPTFVCQTYENQKYAIKYFRKKKLIFYLGKISKIDKSEIYKNVQLLQNNKSKLNLIYKKNISYIDGRGYDRIMNLVYKYLFSKTK